MNNITTGPDSSGKGRGRLRMVGVLVLLLGLGGAGIVYWTGSPPVDLSSDPATARDYKTETRDIEINFGKMGLLLNDLMADLENPGAQASIIALVSILVSSGCFYFAQGPEGGGEPRLAQEGPNERVKTSSPRPSPPQVCGGEGEHAGDSPSRANRGGEPEA